MAKKKWQSLNIGSVYSTEGGKLCPKCDAPIAECRCVEEVPKGDGVVRVGRSTKGRKGKGMTVITGVPLVGAELKALAAELKQRCGTGGTVKDGTIEIQGDQRDLLIEELQKRGYQVKRSGG